MINNLVKNNIKNNLVYHASPFKLDILSGAKTSKWSNETGNVFVTPCKGIAACFLINKNQILDKLSQQFQGKIIGLNFGYDVWNKPVQQLYTIPNNINILLNLPGIKPFSGNSTGYIYTINFSKYRNNCHMFNKNPDSDVEFLIEGNVKFIKCEQVTINWTCMSSQQQIKRKGTAKVIQVYDPPYTYEQILNAGYSQKMNTFDKLFTKILLENKISNIELNELNIKNTNDLNLFLKGVNLAAIASDNDLWDNKIFQITAEQYPDRKWYFLKINNSIIGTLSSRIIKNVIFLSCFAIFQEFQGLGFGYQAMQAIIKYVQTNYPNLKIQLNVAKINKKAQNLYKKCKFKKIKTLPTKFVLQFN